MLRSSLAVLLLAAPVLAAPTPETTVTSALATISPERTHAAVDRLAAFGTRHTLSDRSNPTRGYLAAANWIKTELETLSAASGNRLSVELETFDAPVSQRLPKGGTLTNVVARLRPAEPGDAAPARSVYLMAHLDSRNAEVMDTAGDAPGANDDASGCAVLLECARAVASLPLRATVVFVFTAGEEQGLIGGQYSASRAAAAGETIVAVLNNDIVGDPSTTDPALARTVRLFSEGLPRNPTTERLAQLRANSEESDSPSRELARFVAEIAGIYNLPVRPRLVFRPDRFLRGGDHGPFNEAGFPAIRFTAPAETYDRQHANITERNAKPYGDLPAFVNADYTANVARVNLAAAIHLAMAPPPPTNARIITAKLSTDTTLRWAASPGAARYEVLWRDTTSPTWEHTADTGPATELTLPVSKDESFFAVRSISADGWPSVPVFAHAANE